MRTPLSTSLVKIFIIIVQTRDLASLAKKFSQTEVFNKPTNMNTTLTLQSNILAGVDSPDMVRPGFLLLHT